jgi:hypothetical protein
MGIAREETLPEVGWEEFGCKLTSLRKGTVQWGAARVQQLFIQRLHSKFDGIVALNGRKVHSLSSFTDFVTAGPWDDRMRNIVFYAQDGMWEKCNSWSYNLEAEYTRMLGIAFTGIKANGFRPKRIHKGKCAHYLFVKSKGTLVNTIRNATKRVWKEALFHRRPKVSKAPAVVQPESVTNNTSVPRILHYESSQAISGFNGVIGICEGHPSFLLIPTITHVMGSSAASSNAPSDTSTISSTGSPLTSSSPIQEPEGLDLLRTLMASHLGVSIGRVSQLIETMKQQQDVPGVVVLDTSVVEPPAVPERTVGGEEVEEETATSSVSFFSYSSCLSFGLLITHFLAYIG